MLSSQIKPGIHDILVVRYNQSNEKEKTRQKNKSHIAGQLRMEGNCFKLPTSGEYQSVISRVLSTMTLRKPVVKISKVTS